ncbi:MAG: PocR ligand-binding domain-containing protein [Acholeplasmataceae bacterium]|nr:PocR ligand-binding domain-containing protein [Acholeplasmataceae bacterium]
MKKEILKKIDFKRFNTLLEGFNKSTGFVTAILDLEGNVISKSGWRRICTDFHRVNEETSKNCRISDTVLANNVSEDKKYSIYKCHNGLIDVAVPIIIRGEHVANLFTGQCFLEKPNIDFFINQARRYGFDEKIYLKALEEVPIVNEKQIEDIIDFLLDLTQMIVNLTIDKIEKENSEILLKSSLESPMSFIILAIDKKYNYLYFNQTHKEVMKLAYDKDVKVGGNLMDAITSHTDKINAKKNYDLALSGKSHTTIQEYGDKNVRYYETLYNPIYGSNKEIIGATAYSRDITNRMIMEKELQESEQRFKILHNASFGGIVLHNKGQILECNQGLADITGYTIDELVGMDLLALITPEYRDIVNENIASGYEKPYEVSGIKKNNEIYPLRLEGKNLPYQGQTVRVAEFRDITDIKKAENEIIYRDKLLGYVISHSKQGIAVHDKNLNYVYVSDSYCDMYHVTKDIIGKHHYEIFPDLPQKWREVHQRTLKGEVLSNDRDPFMRADGSIQYTRWLSRPWYDDKGEIAGIIIYTEVINHIVETEIELEKTIERLQLVMDSLPIGIAVNSVDPKVEFEYMNSNFPKLYGTTKEKLNTSDSFWDVVYENPTFREQIKKRVLTDIETNNPKRMIWEDIPIEKNGEIKKFINAYATPIPNSNLLISTVMDVTDRKQKEIDIIYTSNHDYLTGLPNRRYFEEKLFQFDKKEYYPLVVAMIDLDGLKLINDAYGHDIGDDALNKIGITLSNHLRENDFAARIGGDEFVVLCPNTPQKEFETIINSISNESTSLRFNGFNISLSIGYDIKVKESTSIQNILKNAEDNMYANKILHGQSARNETIMTLFETLKEKYDEEKLHSNRVSAYCRMMGESLGLSNDQIKELEFAGLMHDIGKITIPDRILDKPGKLTEEEWVIMKTHTINGYHILRSADKYSQLAEYALTHHERWDGKGYPNGLKEEEIPLFSRVISICDAYEAMTADRPYREALGFEFAVAELNRCAGSQFDGNLVKVFVKSINEKEHLYE